MKRLIGELEGKPDAPATLDHAQCLVKKLESLDTKFKAHHYSVVDLIDLIAGFVTGFQGCILWKHAIFTV